MGKTQKSVKQASSAEPAAEAPIAAALMPGGREQIIPVGAHEMAHPGEVFSLMQHSIEARLNAPGSGPS